MNNITLINYANGEPFESIRKYNSWSAKHIGRVNSVIEYTENDIPEIYKEAHKDIFKYKRGAGLWLWKPYIINETLKKLQDGSWLLYIDSGTFFINDVNHLIRCAERDNQDIFLFEQPLLNRQFTKRECFVKLGIEDNSENQVLAQLVLLRKTQKSIKFVEEWLSLCEQEDLISPDHFHPDIAEFDDYFAHREDQSLLTLLRIKYQLPVYRDCSHHSEFMYTYAYKDFSYVPREYPNSDYPTITLGNRKEHPIKCLLKYWIKKILSCCGIYYTEERWLKNLKSFN